MLYMISDNQNHRKVWTLDKNSSELDSEANSHISDYNVMEKAKEFLFELESSCLEVVLIPAPEPKHYGHQIRAVQYANPKWYAEFCDEYKSVTGSQRRARTYIKRVGTLKSLRKIAGGTFKGVCVERLLDFINRKIANESKTVSEMGYVKGIPF